MIMNMYKATVMATVRGGVPGMRARVSFTGLFRGPFFAPTVASVPYKCYRFFSYADLHHTVRLT